MLSPRVPRKAPRRQRGFSLVEIVVTIAVLALLLAAAMPSIAGFMENTHIRNVADSLQNGLQVARGEAVRRNQEVSFWLVGLRNPSVLGNDCTLSGASGSWVVSVFSPIGHCADDPSTVSAPMLVSGRAAGDAGGGASVSALQSDASTEAVSVTFNGFGRVTNSDAIQRIDIGSAIGSSSARNLRIAISSAGQVRLCDPATSLDGNDPRKC